MNDRQTLSGDIALDLPEFDAPPATPLPLLQRWLARADEVGVREPRAAVLATASPTAEVSSRVVLVKRCNDEGLLFTSHANSRKGRDLAASPRASLTFYWRETLQQVTVGGLARPTPEEVSDELFHERPRAARAAVAVSRQSAPLADESALHAAARRLTDSSDEPARPAGWVAYRLVPDTIEFWHGRADRLHRRLAYSRGDEGWTACRLQP